MGGSRKLTVLLTVVLACSLRAFAAASPAKCATTGTSSDHVMLQRAHVYGKPVKGGDTSDSVVDVDDSDDRPSVEGVPKDVGTNQPADAAEVDDTSEPAQIGSFKEDRYSNNTVICHETMPAQNGDFTLVFESGLHYGSPGLDITIYNGYYHTGFTINGKKSYFNRDNLYFCYWCPQYSDWRIVGLSYLSRVIAGECLASLILGKDAESPKAVTYVWHSDQQEWLKPYSWSYDSQALRPVTAVCGDGYMFSIRETWDASAWTFPYNELTCGEKCRQEEWCVAYAHSGGKCYYKENEHGQQTPPTKVVIKFMARSSLGDSTCPMSPERLHVQGFQAPYDTRNGEYVMKPNKTTAGFPTFWKEDSIYYIYYCLKTGRWNLGYNPYYHLIGSGGMETCNTYATSPRAPFNNMNLPEEFTRSWQNSEWVDTQAAVDAEWPPGRGGDRMLR